MSRTKTALRALPVLLLALALSACATRLGRNFDDAYAQQIKPGETTREEVLANLGRTQLISRSGDEETWTYAYYEGRNAAYNLMHMLGLRDAETTQAVGKQKRLIVVFKGDVVKDSVFREELPVANR